MVEERKTILITGATSRAGQALLLKLIDYNQFNIRILAEDNRQSKATLSKWQPAIKVIYGDITNVAAVRKAVQSADLIIHLAETNWGKANTKPEQAMQVNFGGTRNLVLALNELSQADNTALVYIGSVAELGDRRPPLCWGRIGDPIMPSVRDYYAVSKVAAERYVIDAGIKHWVSLRQTIVLDEQEFQKPDQQLFYNPLNNAVEYITLDDYVRLLFNLCCAYHDDDLSPEFWNHIYNIGGGMACRELTVGLYRSILAQKGITRFANKILNPRAFAEQNYFGQYFLDSDKLNNYLDFQHDTLDDFYHRLAKLPEFNHNFSKSLADYTLGEKIVADSEAKKLRKLNRKKGGIRYAIEDDDKDFINLYFGGRKKFLDLPYTADNFINMADLVDIHPLDHGYDEDKQKLDFADLKQVATARGGKVLSFNMKPGDMTTPKEFSCAKGHKFTASPKLVVEGGHWCPICERVSWNYAERAETDQLVGQVWYKLHAGEPDTEYPKAVNEYTVIDPAE